MKVLVAVKRVINCNEDRPYSVLGNLTPSAFAAQLKPVRKVA